MKIEIVAVEEDNVRYKITRKNNKIEEGLQVVPDRFLNKPKALIRYLSLVFSGTERTMNSTLFEVNVANTVNSINTVNNIVKEYNV